MGTLVRITLYAPGEQAANDAFRAAFARIATLDAVLSDYQPRSELSRVTVNAVGRAVPVSRDLFTVLAASQVLAEATGGAFDVTLGPVIRLWREARKTARVPDAAALHEAASRSGFQKLHLDPANQTVTMDCAGMALDVGGIGKGYAASEALAVITGLGVPSALVAVSGDLAFSDPPPGQRGWRIGINGSGLPAIPDVLELANAAVSTSGDSEQHVDIDGRRYSHIIDPASGTGLVSDISVTVVAPHGLEADGLDTAISVLGATRGLALLESHPAAAALVILRTSAGTAVRPSASFLELVSRQAAHETRLLGRGDPSSVGAAPSAPGDARGASPGSRARSQNTGP
ncbi:MAG: FAD:protein FMN transferase [Acidobacteriota bacterium]